jgi:dTMP kinase
MTRGFFVVLEGIDGSGKSTQALRLADALGARGFPVLRTRQPSDGPLGRLLREYLGVPSNHQQAPSWQQVALMFAADRLDHLRRDVEPALASGQIVICDRYDLSSLAYQTLRAEDGEARDLGWVQRINAKARRPDVTYVLDVRATLAWRRLQARGGPRERFDSLEQLEALARTYDHAERILPGLDAVVHVPGENSEAEVTAMLLASLTERLRIWGVEPRSEAR